MSDPLIDFRGKHTKLTSVMLEAEERETGKKKAEIEREVMDAWAIKKKRATIVAHALLRAEGLAGEDEGIGGKHRERHGGGR